jgi:hypothetical protein
VIDILVQPHRDQRAAAQFFRRLLRGQGQEPLCILTDKLRSYSAALPTIAPRPLINRPARERQMRRFKSHGQAQRFCLPPGCRPESFSSWAPFTEIYESPALAIAILRGLADPDRDLRRLLDKRPLRTKTTLFRLT